MPIGPHARHFYDIYQLAGRDEIVAMLGPAKYGEIRDDYKRIRRAHY